MNNMKLDLSKEDVIELITKKELNVFQAKKILKEYPKLLEMNVSQENCYLSFTWDKDSLSGYDEKTLKKLYEISIDDSIDANVVGQIVLTTINEEDSKKHLVFLTIGNGRMVLLENYSRYKGYRVGQVFNCIDFNDLENNLNATPVVVDMAGFYKSQYNEINKFLEEIEKEQQKKIEESSKEDSNKPKEVREMSNEEFKSHLMSNHPLIGDDRLREFFFKTLEGIIQENQKGNKIIIYRDEDSLTKYKYRSYAEFSKITSFYSEKNIGLTIHDEIGGVKYKFSW